MAIAVSRRLLRSLGSFPTFGQCNSSCIMNQSLYNSHEIYGRVNGGSSMFAGYSTLLKGLSTSILTPESSKAAFPSDLLSATPVELEERKIGSNILPHFASFIKLQAIFRTTSLWQEELVYRSLSWLTNHVALLGLLQDLMIPVTNFQNEDKGFMVLAGDVFDVPIRKDIIHRVVRWQLAKRQQGTHSTKTISEVSGTGRKPWRQKGTGRARHGTLRGPQFRGGAAMHGPKPRSHAFKLNKKVRRLGLKIALSARAAEGKLLVFDNLDVPTHKTKNIVNYFNEMEKAKKLLLVDGGPIDEKLKLATQNLHYVNVLPSIGLNVYSILLHDTLVMSRDAIERIVTRMHTPINR